MATEVQLLNLEVVEAVRELLEVEVAEFQELQMEVEELLPLQVLESLPEKYFKYVLSTTVQCELHTDGGIY